MTMGMEFSMEIGIPREWEQDANLKMEWERVRMNVDWYENDPFAQEKIYTDFQ